MTTNGNIINISTEELKKLKQIGSGSDGKVFKYNNDIVLKFYRENLFKIKEYERLMQKEDKTYNKDKKIKWKDINKLHYYIIEDEKIRIRSNEAIDRIVKRQENLKRNNLPKGPVYFNNKFAGCYYKKLSGIQIHKLTGLPIKHKYKLIKSLLLDIEELINNNIYHIDLANSYLHESYLDDEEGKSILSTGHSHILINPFGKLTNIIDLDGKSTIYTENYSFEYEQMCLVSLCTLLIEFLFAIDTREIKEIDEIEFELSKFGLNKELCNKFASMSFNNFDELKKSLIL